MENMDKQVITRKYINHQFVLHIPSYVCCILDERLLKSHLESPLDQLVSRFMETLDSSAKKSVNKDHRAHKKSFRLSGVVMVPLKQENHSPSFFSFIAEAVSSTYWRLLRVFGWFLTRTGTSKFEHLCLWKPFCLLFSTFGLGTGRAYVVSKEHLYPC